MRQTSLRIVSLVGSLAVVVAATTTAQAEQTTTDGSLKWTPHRAAARPLDGGVEEALAAAATTPVAKPATPPVAEPAPAATVTQTPPAADNPLPPATVAVPDAIPAATARPQMQVVAKAPEEGFAPLRKQFDPGQMVERFGDWVNNGQPAEAAGSASATEDGPLGMGLMRTPQGHRAGRPMVAHERPVDLQDIERQRAGGGLAPRYSPAVARTAVRPERLAMDVDNVPSVMSQRAQAEAVAPPPASRQPTKAPASQGDEPLIIETTPGSMSDSLGGYVDEGGSMGDDMWMGSMPAQLHVESFYDDPYACEEDCDVVPWHFCHGRVCNWLRQFGRPYYGWRWYRDLTASVGVTAFQNEASLGLFGNFGTNEYINWSMPFWNAFGLGWQLGARGTQTGFGSASVGGFESRSRNQTFVTTGFFTRAFEGRGLQGGAVYDYLHDSFFDNVDLAQFRGEVSYVWGYHELGFWGAFNSQGATGFFQRSQPTTQNQASTVHVYTGFYRMQFGDANEVKIWGGVADGGRGYLGSTCRAPMSRSLALEGTFAYLTPGRSKPIQIDNQGGVVNFTPTAWNLAINLVYYPASRSRRSLSSPYRPLFDVADNGTMIRAISQ